jgi:NAD(P)-dependent dehydrogenase (short-subunit alcohol dehydrogenase family)
LAPAAADASVGLADVNEDGIRAATRRLQATGGEAVPLRMDVTDPESVSTAVVTLKQELGPVGILVNNVAISRSTPIWEIDLEEFDRIMDVNVRGGFICLRAVLRGMMQRRRGRIV